MTAQEARATAETAQLSLLSLYQCLDIVKAACYLKQTQVVLPASPSSTALAYLQEMGYGYSNTQRRLIW